MHSLALEPKTSGSESTFRQAKSLSPAFLTMIIMPVAYSISDGILIGVISYVACHAVAGKFKQVSITMWILAILFICKYIFI